MDNSHVASVTSGSDQSGGTPAHHSFLSVSTPSALPIRRHYPGRPLPNLPHGHSLAVTPTLASTSVLAAAVVQGRENDSEARDNMQQRTGHGLEDLLITFDDDDDDLIDSFNSSSISIIGGGSSSEGSDLQTLMQHFIHEYGTTQRAQDQTSVMQPLPSSSLPRPPPSPSALVGRVEIEVDHQRLHGAGSSRDHAFIKLKLSLLGLSVESCGICLSQFEVGELAALGLECQHA